jgi:hypothetical protein
MCDAASINEGSCGPGSVHAFSFEAVSPGGTSSNRLQMVVAVDSVLATATFQLHMALSAAHVGQQPMERSKLVAAMGRRDMATNELLLAVAAAVQQQLEEHVERSPMTCSPLQAWATGTSDGMKTDFAWPPGVNVKTLKPLLTLAIATTGGSMLEARALPTYPPSCKHS